MALTHQSRVRRWHLPPTIDWLVVAAAGLALATTVAIMSVALHEAPSSATRGSGVSVSDVREVAPFARVELAGANTVTVDVGRPLSVTVTGDDNLVGRVTTVVRAGQLVIDNTGDFTTEAPMHVAVSVPTLDGVELGGAGTVTVNGVTSADFSAELTGSGTLVVSGVAQVVTGVLAGTGTLDLHGLVANVGTAQLDGTGTIRTHAASTLDATLTGTGTILYRGDPTVTIDDRGTGTVAPE